MDYRRLLVHLDRQDRWERRMPVIGRIAHRWHARREQVLGGVTQTLLQTSQLPLLMSH